MTDSACSKIRSTSPGSIFNTSTMESIDKPFMPGGSTEESIFMRLFEWFQIVVLGVGILNLMLRLLEL